MRKYWLGFSLIIVVGFFMMTEVFTANTYAKVKTADNLYGLSLLQGVRQCYENEAKDEVEITPEEASDYWSFRNILKDEDKNKPMIYVTTDVNQLSCDSLFSQLGGSFDTKFLDNKKVSDVISDIGYEYSKDKEDGTAYESAEGEIKFSVNFVNNNVGNTSKVETSGEVICPAYREDGVWRIDDSENCSGSLEARILGDGILYSLDFNDKIHPYDMTIGGYGEAAFGSNVTFEELISLNEAEYDEDLVGLKEAFDNSSFKERIYNFIFNKGREKFGENIGVSIVSESIFEESFEATKIYKPLRNNKKIAAGVLSKNLTNSSVVEYPVLQNAGLYKLFYWDTGWKYSLYYNYLLNAVSKYPSLISLGSCSNERGVAKYAFKNTSSQWCTINISDVDQEGRRKEVVLEMQFPTITNDQLFLEDGKFESVLEWLSDVDSYKYMPEDGYADGIVNEDGFLDFSNDDNDLNDEAVCYTESGSLGWIICPIITAIDGVGNHMWKQIENYHLKIPASEVFKSDGGVETGWGVVRNIANTVFIILFLVVIFSQLTGRGIDNYGIKKILPRLIVIAVLVNLSYLICELAVDLSNIFGMGLNDMFSGWAGDISAGSSAESAGAGAQVGAWVLTAILGGGGAILFSTLSAGSLLGGFAGIGLAVLGILVVIIVAMLTLYLILIAREAGIVLSIIIAPVAIVCYALPNTEKFAKKWFDLFKALIIVYPICGAMVGGGQLAGSILASINNPGMKIAAMIVQVLPFFLVPTLFKNSLSLMGNVGSKISSLGKSLGKRGSSGLRGAIRNSERFKDWSQYQKDNAAERRALRTKTRLDRRSNGHISSLTQRQRDRLSKANEAIKAAENRRQQANISAQNDVFEADLARQRFQNEENAADRLVQGDANYIAGKMQSNRLQREDDIGNTLLYRDGQYVAGKAAQNRLRQENEREGTVLYTRPGFEQARRNQYEAQRRGEIKKMYGDRYANLDKIAKQAALSTALSGSGIDAEEQVDAAVDALLSTGDVTELLNALHGADFTTMDTGVRERMVAKAAASGNQLLKGWAKTGGAVNLQNYIDDTTTSGLRNYIATQAGEHAFDTADKDTLDFLANHNGANAMSDAMIGNILTSSANTNQTAMAAAIRLAGGREAGVGATINAEGLTKMSGSVASALGVANLSRAIAEVNKPGNETVKAKISNPVKMALGIT